MKERRAFTLRWMMVATLVTIVGVSLYFVSENMDTDDNDLWLVKSLAANNQKLGDVASFASVSDKKNNFDKSMGFIVHPHKARLFEFRLVRHERTIILRSYGETENKTLPSVDTSKLELAAAYGEVPASRLHIGFNQQIVLPLTDLSDKSKGEMARFYRDFGRPFPNFDAGGELARLKSHVLWRNVAFYLSTTSLALLAGGVALFSISFLLLTLAICDWRALRKKLLAQGEMSSSEYKLISREVPAPSTWSYLVSSNPEKPILNALRRRVQLAKQREEEREKSRHRVEKLVAQELAAETSRVHSSPRKGVHDSRETPVEKRERLVKAVVRLASDNLPLLPETSTLLEEAKSTTNLEEATKLLRRARNIQWRAVRGHSHAH